MPAVVGIFEIIVVKAAFEPLIVVFALLELSTRLRALAFVPRRLPFSGVVPAFFGVLSGIRAR